jgi:hypothetical protein
MQQHYARQTGNAAMTNDVQLTQCALAAREEMPMHDRIAAVTSTHSKATAAERR